ncbi:MAG: hypothetical protein IFK94_15840 [Acidobacteria bacterium]|uniref:Uncharacterized protein n=1 Tax=Candidatus Polarisedimenticola svalbardensis TaxID=2886004 RepID=A0A8J6XVS1_9BACT|nr:hypothetical protein [Candidatus Polarisedimenticola svalbardensis]
MFPHHAMEDHRGMLWAGGTGWVCHIDLSVVDGRSSWTCEDLPGKHQMK